MFKFLRHYAHIWQKEIGDSHGETGGRASVKHKQQLITEKYV